MWMVCWCWCIFTGADLSDYFNYGFNEDTWKAYCEKQKRLRMGLEVSSVGSVTSKITVRAVLKVSYFNISIYFLSPCIHCLYIERHLMLVYIKVHLMRIFGTRFFSLILKTLWEMLITELIVFFSW